MTVYIFAAEYISLDSSKGEILVFRRGHRSGSAPSQRSPGDEESGSHAPGDRNTHQGNEATSTLEEGRRPQVAKQKSIFHWKDVCYDINIKGKPRRILDHVDGWVKPGTLTALMVRYRHLPILGSSHNPILILCYLGCNWRWENHFIGCLSESCLGRSGHGRYIGQRSPTRQIFPAQDRLRTTTGRPLGNCNSERGVAI